MDSMSVAGATTVVDGTSYQRETLSDYKGKGPQYTPDIHRGDALVSINSEYLEEV